MTRYRYEKMIRLTGGMTGQEPAGVLEIEAKNDGTTTLTITQHLPNGTTQVITVEPDEEYASPVIPGELCYPDLSYDDGGAGASCVIVLVRTIAV